MHWQLQFFPVCTHHVFLSHCREDRGWLVNPLADALRDRRLIPWVDQHDYPYGRTSFQALRDGVLRSRHVVFLVTDAMLQQPRGWSLIELAWAELLQDNLREPGGVLQNVSLPLFFVAREDVRLPRCAWFPVIDRARFHLPADGNPISWALRQIDAFVAREVEQGLDNVAWLDGDSRSRLRLKKRAGLIERINALHPAALETLG